MPKLAALRAPNSVSKTLVPAVLGGWPSPPQASVIESPRKSRSTSPFLAISTNLSWRLVQLTSRGAGLMAEWTGLSWARAGTTASTRASEADSIVLIRTPARVDRKGLGRDPVCGNRDPRSRKSYDRPEGAVYAPVLAHPIGGVRHEEDAGVPGPAGGAVRARGG